MKLRFVGEDTLYDVELNAIKPNVIEAIGEFPHEEKGFKIYVPDIGYALNYEAYNTIYKDFEDKCWYSNDGSVWTEPVRDIIVKAVFTDIYPDPEITSVTVNVFNGNELVGTLTLTPENNFTYTYNDIPVSIIYTIEAQNIENYRKYIDDTTVTYVKSIPTPSQLELLDQKINGVSSDVTDTQIGLSETYEITEGNSDEILDCQLALAELYEMIIGGSN